MATSLHRQILEAVQSQIRHLNLQYVDDDQVVIWKDTLRIERLDAGQFPCVGIFHGGESEQYRTLNNGQEEVGYPVIVALCDTDRADGKPSQSLRYDARLYWRQRVIRAFDGLPLITDVCYCTLSPRQIMVPPEWLVGRWISNILFYFWARVTRI